MTTTSTPATDPRFRTARHFVVDVETLDTRPSAAVLSIALVRLDGDFFEPVPVRSWRLHSRGQERRTLDMETCLWWMRQGGAARASVTTTGEAEHLHTVLRELHAAVVEPSGDFCLWAKPQHFDVPVLESLFETGRLLKLGEELFHRRKVHNARTLYETTSLVVGTLVEEQKDEAGAHDAMADAMCTAGAVGRCLRLLHEAAHELTWPRAGT